MKNIFLLIASISLLACQSKAENSKPLPTIKTTSMNEENNKTTEVAIFAGGCFWCTEALFQSLKGVETVLPGYIGGATTDPTYKEVCTGTTGHAEAVEITFNPDQISYSELLEIFFATHDPTTLNRQGADVGTQYRSEIFYTTENQHQVAQQYLDILKTEQVYPAPIVTQLSAATHFYTAEDYHKNYYAANKGEGYCQMVIAPKLDKFKKAYSSKLK